MKKKILAFAVTALMMLGTLALTGCGGENSAADNADKLIVGVNETNVPMTFTDENGELTGFDIDLAAAVAEEMGLDVEFRPIDWNSKEAELEAGNIDCVWSGLSETPEAKGSMALSDRYAYNLIALMHLTDNDDGDTSADFLMYQHDIGTVPGTIPYDMLKENTEYPNFKNKLKEYDSYDDAVAALRSGEIDIIAIDLPLGEYISNKDGDYLGNQLNGEFKRCSYCLGDDFYVVGFAKDNTKLRDRVNKALDAVYESGQTIELGKKWFGTGFRAIVNLQ